MNTFLAASAAMLGWLLVERHQGGQAPRRSAPRPARSPAWSRSRRAPASSAAWRRSTSGPSPASCAAWPSGIKKAFKFDDSLDVVAVHLVGGLVGSILLGFFADSSINALVDQRGRVPRRRHRAAHRPDRRLGGRARLLVRRHAHHRQGHRPDMGLRVDEAAEDEGLDISQHAETAYASRLRRPHTNEADHRHRQAVQARRREGRTEGSRRRRHDRSPRSRASAASPVTPRCTGARSTRSTSCPR